MLNVSIVIYKHTISDISPLVEILQNSGLVSEIFLIDNSPKENKDFGKLNANYIFNNCNLGYGKAHNIALRKSIAKNTPYHLVVNPDISFEPEILKTIVTYMENHPDVGHLMPKVFYPNGDLQYLCKLLPTPTDLIFRRFLQKNVRDKRMRKFELRESGYNRIMNIPYLSGCFMFLRTEALKVTGIFDERFFMYPEDIDLTRRIHQHFKTIFYPEVAIVHHHAQSSYSSPKMLWIHIINMIRYFNKWGWIFDRERKRINANILIGNTL